MDSNGDENFKAVMKEIKKKNHVINKPCYQLFDILTIDEFYGRKKSPILSDRLDLLNSTIDMLGDDIKSYLKPIKQIHCKSQKHFEKLRKSALEKGWEGIMVRHNTTYENKRSCNLLKVKSFYDAEYEVVEIESTIKKMLIDGVMQNIECLGAVYIEHKGFKTKVGSGLSDQQRIEFYNNPSKIIGKIITVQYFEETYSDKNTISLRFPILKYIHGDERDV